MATEKLRAVLDTNVPIAAHLSRNPSSPTAELLRCWKDKEYKRIEIVDGLTFLRRVRGEELTEES